MSESVYKSTLTETCALLPRYIDLITSKINNSIILLEKNDEYQEELSDICLKLSHFISIVSIIHRDRIWETYDNQTLEVLRTLKIHQLSIVKALKSAMKSQDLLMLTDLLEYELKDNLTQWKISAIPQLKQAIKNIKSQPHTTF